jgi:riboflavin kinase/FMN adenylyltransferase
MGRISQALGLYKLILGYDSALGRNREADASRLAEIGDTFGYTVETVPPLSDEAGIISSTRIRSAIREGKVDQAAGWLGRTYSIKGQVERGDGRGRKIGVPTANLRVPPGKLIPADGIYATWAWVGGGKVPAATSIGLRPTFESTAPERTVEAHLLDFDQDLYGQEIRLEFVTWLRAEKKFDSIDTLVEQMQDDITRSREILI